MSEEEIVKLIGILVGDIEPYGETYHDDNAKNHIEKLGTIINMLIYDMGVVAVNFYNSAYHSEDECAEKAIEMLSLISKEINDTFEELKAGGRNEDN